MMIPPDAFCSSSSFFALLRPSFYPIFLFLGEEKLSAKKKRPPLSPLNISLFSFSLQSLHISLFCDAKSALRLECSPLRFQAVLVRFFLLGREEHAFVVHFSQAGGFDGARHVEGLLHVVYLEYKSLTLL